MWQRVEKFQRAKYFYISIEQDLKPQQRFVIKTDRRHPAAAEWRGGQQLNNVQHTQMRFRAHLMQFNNYIYKV